MFGLGLVRTSILYAVPPHDGAQIFKQDWLNGNLIGEPRVVVTLPFSFPAYHVGSAYDFSRDRSTVVYVGPVGHADVYLLIQK